MSELKSFRPQNDSAKFDGIYEAKGWWAHAALAVGSSHPVVGVSFTSTAGCVAIACIGEAPLGCVSIMVVGLISVVAVIGLTADGKAKKRGKSKAESGAVSIDK